MTETEFKDLVAEQKKKGLDEKDIAEVFCGMFADEKINRKQLEAILGELGFELEEEFAKMDDEELRKNLFKKEEKAESKEREEKAKEDPKGDLPPKADKDDSKSKEEEKETREKILNVMRE